MARYTLTGGLRLRLPRVLWTGTSLTRLAARAGTSDTSGTALAAAAAAKLRSVARARPAIAVDSFGRIAQSPLPLRQILKRWKACKELGVGGQVSK